MDDPNNEAATTPQNTAETVIVSPTQSLKESVSASLAGCGPKVRESIVKVRVDDEMNRRVEIGKKGLTLLEKLEGELKGIKPDNQTFNDDGSVKDTSWSKPALERKKKAQEKVTAVSSAVRAAFENDKFDELEKAIQKHGQGGGGGDKNQSPEAKGPDGD